MFAITKEDWTSSIFVVCCSGQFAARKQKAGPKNWSICDRNWIISFFNDWFFRIVPWESLKFDCMLSGSEVASRKAAAIHCLSGGAQTASKFTSSDQLILESTPKILCVEVRASGFIRLHKDSLWGSFPSILWQFSGALLFSRFVEGSPLGKSLFFPVLGNSSSIVVVARSGGSAWAAAVETCGRQTNRMPLLIMAVGVVRRRRLCLLLRRPIVV